MPVRKYTKARCAPFQRIRAIPNAAMEPIIMLKISVIMQTINEFSVAIPSLPAVHANVKFSKVGFCGRANGAVKIYLF